MAQQIKVNSSTGNIQIQISRGAIGPSTTANIANTALNLNAASTANVVIGGGVANYVLQTDGAGNTSWVAQTGGGATNPAGANTQVQFNDQGSFGAESNFTYDKATDVLTADHFSGEGGNLSNIQGANVSGAVANATHATISDSANSVAVANVAGIGNIATVNLDGNVSNVLAGDGTFIAAGGGGGTYGDSNVVTLLNAFGSNTITTTGLITGDGGGLSNIAGANISGAVANATHATVADSANAVAGANVTGEVSFAAVANSVTLANVSGAGNIASLNIDGNVSNVLRGDGTFAADANSSYGDSNVVTLLGAFGSNTITTTGNVDTGNLSATTSLTVNGVDGNLLVQPGVAFNGRKYSSISRGEFNAGNSTLNQAFITDSYNADGVLSFDTFANTSGGVLAEGGAFNIQNFSAIGNTTTDPFVPATITFSAAPTSANLASPQTSTHTSMQIGGSGGFNTIVGAEGSDSFAQGAWRQFQYRPRGIEFFRRAGNGEAREGVVANDETSIVFYMASNNGAGSSTWASNPARIAAKVDSTFSGADNAVVPTGLEFSVNTDADATLTHNMYANGDVTFNATGVITGDGGGLSNIASANVSGLGNISTINLDGNAANYLGGTGVWGPVTAVNANFANFAGNVTLSNQPNITQTGNLLTFTTNDGVANTATHQIDPTLITMPVNYSDTEAQEVITLFGDDVSPNYFGGQGTTTFLMNDINTGTPGFSPVVTDYAASNGASGYSQAVRIETGMDFVGVPPSGTNAYAPGRVQYTFAGAQSDLNNADTLGSVKLNQTGVTIQPNTQASTSGIINILHYGTDPSDPTDANGLDFQRRRGNNASKVDIAAGDYLGNIRWAGRKATGSQFNKARIGGRVSTTWNGTDNNIPTELFFRTQDNAGTSYDVEFKSDGQATFPGNLTLNGSGIFTGDGGGLSNVAGTTTPGGVSGTIQYNNAGTMDGDSRFEFSPTAGSGTQPQISLEGATGPAPGIFNLNNGILNMFTENLSGGYSPMSFSTYNPSGFIEPINYYRARGTRSVPTATAAGDFIKNERFQAYSGSANFATQFTYAGGYTSQVQANDGLGNIATTTIISTALPANGPDTNDKILFDTEYTAFRGNITMNAQYSSATLGRITQLTQTFASLPASPVVGERAMITDSTASGGSVGTVVSVGGGTFVIPVYWDGSNWKMG